MITYLLVRTETPAGLNVQPATLRDEIVSNLESIGVQAEVLEIADGAHQAAYTLCLETTPLPAERCPSILSGLRCELQAGHGRYHKRGTAGWEDPA